MKNILKYSIRDEMLYGSVADESFSMKAFSGGGRGSTAGMELHDLKHWSTNKKAPPAFTQRSRGGPLPVGMYLVKYYGFHDHLGRCAILMQTLSSLLHADPWSDVGVSVTDRSGFYIHGRGPKGSDGCIVPSKGSDLKSLLDTLEDEGSVIALFVQDEGVNAEKLDVKKNLKKHFLSAVVGACAVGLAVGYAAAGMFTES